MNNDPLLFIDSVKDEAKATSNQEFFDSRSTSRKKVARHRLEDIEAMLYYRIHVLAEIHTKDRIIEGIVTKVSEDGLVLQTEDKEIKIPIVDIVDINILKL